jgi:dihydroorotate dehydrogenase (fumarate)
MPDLSTTYLGLSLRNPLVASASPLSKTLDRVRQLEDAGAAAVVIYSLFEEQITREVDELDCYLNLATNSYAEALNYFPDLEHYNVGPDGYLEHLRKMKEAVDIPVIGSLNGVSAGGWVDYAQKIEQAGADALELNIYYLPTDLEMSSSALEKIYVNLVREVRAAIHIPLALKLVLFNRFYQPDFDLEAFEVVPHLELSTSHELLLPLRWIALLYGRVYADLALTSGVHRVQDVVKAVMAGANVTMLASELLLYGPERIRQLLEELDKWMEQHEYLSVTQMRGCMSQSSVAEPAAFERANYMKALNLFDSYLPG